ncbi:MAG: bacterial Ig-like domain-containing protein, partial [Bacilli bacterium]
MIRGLLSTDKEIIITYEGKEVKINITVSKPASALSKIEITTNPTKMNYIVGEIFDPTGMIITATYEDNTTSIVEDYTLSVTGALKSTDTNIVITYNGKTTTLVIQIKKVVLDETDYTIASVLSFTDANNYKLGTTVAASEGGKSATKGASRKFTDGTEAVRLRANRNPGAYIEVS